MQVSFFHILINRKLSKKESMMIKNELDGAEDMVKIKAMLNKDKYRSDFLQCLLSLFSKLFITSLR